MGCQEEMVEMGLPGRKGERGNTGLQGPPGMQSMYWTGLYIHTPVPAP